MNKVDIIIAGIMALSYIGFIVYEATGHIVLNKWGAIRTLGFCLLAFLGGCYLPLFIRFMRFSVVLLFAWTIWFQVEGPYYGD